MAADESTPAPIPNLELQQHRFVLSKPECSARHNEAAKALLAGVKDDEMAPYLASLVADSSLPAVFRESVPSDLLPTLQKANEDHLASLDAKLKDAQENEGETEISDVLRSRAHYLARIGEHERAREAYEAAFAKQAGAGGKIDIRLGLLRVGFFYGDHALIREQLAKTEELIEAGGDWDRRNRLRVYRGMYRLSVRDFKEGTGLLLDTLSTFTATELLSYEDFVSLAIVGAALSLDRKDLKAKVIDSPEVAQVVPDRPHLLPLVTSLYNTEYSQFFHNLAEVEQRYLVPSRILSPHARYYVREMRIKAYSQLLESYRSVTLRSMASAFGVTEDFVDSELSRFIAAGRLNCSIDRVNGVIDTTRPDAKNAMYASVVKNGDALLNSIQRLSRVVA